MPLGDRIVKLVLSHTLTWLALAVVIAIEAAFFDWFRPSLTMAVVALALGVLSIVAWPLLFVRSESFAKLMYHLPQEVDADRKERLRVLVSDFEDLDFSQGAAQLHQLREKFENLSEIVKRRLSAGELTYARYLGMAEQVYLSAFDNLQEVSVALRSVSTIDTNYIQSRLRELSKSDGSSGEEQEESIALQKRIDLYVEQKQRTARLIAQNEVAMTVLDRTATALAGTKTGKGQASMDAKAAIAELERLAKRAGEYAATD
jgi:hypothetical protein